MILLPIVKTTDRGIELDYLLTKKGKLFPVDSFFDLVESENFIIQNFTLIKYSIIELLLKREDYHEKQDARDITRSYDIRKEYIKIHIQRGVTCCICSYENKFLQEFVDFETAERLEAVDRWKKPSVAQDGKSELLETISTQKNYFGQMAIFNKIFPQQSEEEFAFWLGCKESVKPFLFLKKPALFENVYSYDIKASFSARVYRRLFPQGKGEFFGADDEIPIKKWYIKKICISSIQSKIYDFLGFEKLYKSNDTPFLYVYITKDIEEILSEVYEIEYTTQSGYFYKLQRGIFDGFIENCIFSQDNNFEPFKKYNKGRCNSLWGTFGRNDEITELHYYLDEEDERIIKYDIEEKIIDEKSYYPMYLYINGRAKCELIKLIMPYFSNLLYANTDGFFLNREADFDYKNAVYTSKIGRVELRTMYNQIAIKEISNYCGMFIDDDGVINYDARISGRKHKSLTLEEFANGFPSVLYSMTSFGFVEAYEYNELPLAIYSKLDVLKKRIEYMLNFFNVTRYGKNIELEESRKNEGTEAIYSLILEELEQKTVLYVLNNEYEAIGALKSHIREKELERLDICIDFRENISRESLYNTFRKNIRSKKIVWDKIKT